MKTTSNCLKVLALLMFLTSGCLTTNTELNVGFLAHDVGYAATVAYFYQKNNNKNEDYVKAAELSYDILTFVVREDQNISIDIEDYIISLVNERTEDVNVKIASISLIRLYGKRLRSRLNWESLRDDARLQTLKDFYSGIERAIEDLDPVLGESASIDNDFGEVYAYLYSDGNGEIATYVLDCGVHGHSCSSSCSAR